MAESRDRSLTRCNEERDASRVRVDPSLEAACTADRLAAYEACQEPIVSADERADHPCVLELEGLGEPGDSCASDRQCAAGLLCVQPVWDADGTCEPGPDAGEPCTADYRCAAEPFCDADGCRERLGDGADCAEYSAPCAGDLTCLVSTGTCGDPRPNGSACWDPSECLSGSCAGGCLDEGQCTASSDLCVDIDCA